MSLTNQRNPFEAVQLDLFTDSPTAQLATGVFWALARCDAIEARRLLLRLQEIAPTHSQWSVFSQLSNALDSLSAPVADAAGEIGYLQASLLPLVKTVLGKDGRLFSTRCWQRLTHALVGQPYDANSPNVHSSYTAMQINDWSTVREAVESEHNWDAEPVLIVRHAHACEHLQAQADALQSWFRLCWSSPEQAACIDSSSNAMLREQWREFQGLDPELPNSAFPAWSIIVTPGLFRLFPDVGADGNAMPASYQTVLTLQQSADKNNQAQKIHLRALLKQQDPLLFGYYLAELSAA